MTKKVSLVSKKMDLGRMTITPWLCKVNYSLAKPFRNR